MQGDASPNPAFGSQGAQAGAALPRLLVHLPLLLHLVLLPLLVIRQVELGAPHGVGVCRGAKGVLEGDVRRGPVRLLCPAAGEASQASEGGGCKAAVNMTNKL